MNSPIDHPKINMMPEEYARIKTNMRMYKGDYPAVAYTSFAGQQCTRPLVPLNVVKLTASWMSTLLYNEKCKINMADKEAQKFIENILLNNRFNANFQEYLEVCYAVGGIAIRPYYSQAEAKIKISWGLPDRFFPLSSTTSGISEGVFISKTTEIKNGKIEHYSLCEFHEWIDGVYTITNELYKSEKTDALGKKVLLSSVEKYANLPEKSAVPTASRSRFVYVKPAQMNNIEPDSPLGIGMCDNARHTIDTINLIHDKFWQNIKRSMAGVAVPPEHLNATQENGVVYVANNEDNVFIQMPGATGDTPYKEITIPIDVQPHVDSINFELRIYEMQTGFSPGTFSFDRAGGIKTATEVVSEDSMTYQTRNKQTVVLEQALSELVHIMLEIGAENGIYAGKLEQDVTVDFDDGVFQDKNAQLEYYVKAYQGKLIPKRIAIQRANNLSEEDARAWAAEIESESTQEGAKAGAAESENTQRTNAKANAGKTHGDEPKA